MQFSEYDFWNFSNDQQRYFPVPKICTLIKQYSMENNFKRSEYEKKIFT